MRIRSENVRMLGKLVVVAAGMFGVRLCAGAAVPADLRRRWASTSWPWARSQVPGNGVAGKDVRVPGNTQVDRTRTITVEFDANARGPVGIQARAGATMQVHPGELDDRHVRVPERAEPHAWPHRPFPSYAPQAG
jgi:cytochrome c oxidase assembly protein subunit 11